MTTGNMNRPGRSRMDLSRREFMGASGALVAGAALSTLTGCSGGSGSGGHSNARLSLVVDEDTLHPSGQQQALNKLKSMFESQNPGAKLDWSTYTSSSDELTKLETSAASHQGPDVLSLGTTVVPSAWATNVFETITPAMWTTLGGKDSIFQSALTMCGPSLDSLMSVPSYGKPFAMAYNTRMFKEAGISAAPTTWSGFVTAARAMTRPSEGQWGAVLAPADGFIPWHMVWLFSAQAGHPMMSADGKTPLLDSDGVVDAAAFWLDWITTYKIASPQCVTYKEADQVQAFASGKAAMIVMEGPQMIPTLESSAIKGQYAFAPNPVVPYGMTSLPAGSKPIEAFVSGESWSIFKYSKNKDLALKLVALMLTPEMQHEFFTQEGLFPLALKTFDKYPDTKQPPWDTFYEAEDRSAPTPFVGSWGQLEVIVGQAIQKMLGQIASDGKYSKTALKAALTQANSQLAASIPK